MFNVYKNNRHSEETSWRCDDNIEPLTVYWTRRDFSLKKRKKEKFYKAFRQSSALTLCFDTEQSDWQEKKKIWLFQIHLQKQTAVISDFGPS